MDNLRGGMGAARLDIAVADRRIHLRTSDGRSGPTGVLLGAAVAALLASACGGGGTATGAPSPSIGLSGTVATRSPTNAAVIAAPACSSRTVTVSSQANIFGAGIADLPEPAGGGGGVTPVCVPLAVGVKAVVVNRATGSASFTPLGAPTVQFHRCQSGQEVSFESGPDGSVGGCPGERPGGVIEAAGVVSGIASIDRVAYLAGVFLPPSAPSGPPPPPSLDFDGNHNFASLRPLIAQVFFIGDGRGSRGALQRFQVPDGATRLYLGIADAFGFKGPPGYYGDNAGSFEVHLSFIL
jgi:hypothetical protein